MRTLKRVESSKRTEKLMTSSGQDGSRQPSGGSDLAPKSQNGNQGTSLAGEGKHPAWALPALGLQQVVPAVVTFPPGGVAFRHDAQDQRRDGVVRIPSRADDDTKPHRDIWHEAPRGDTCKSGQDVPVQRHEIAFDETHAEENALPPGEFGRTTSSAFDEHTMSQCVHDMGLGAAADVYSLPSDIALIASPIKAPQQWYQFDSSDSKMDPDDEIDMEVGPSIPIPMEEDKFGPTFGCWTNIRTCDPRLAYRSPPYIIRDVTIEQNNDLDFVEDSTMEDAREDHREVAATVTVTQTTQQSTFDTPVIPGVVPNVQSCVRIQTAPFSSPSVHPFQSSMLGNLHTLDKLAPENASFAQVIPPQGVASLIALDGTPSSTPMLEVEALKKEGMVISSISPTPDLIVVASHTANHSSLSVSSASPSRDGSTSPSLSPHGAIRENKREVEGLVVSVRPQPTVAGIQREDSPFGYVRISLFHVRRTSSGYI
jgi:hypothetical protein